MKNTSSPKFTGRNHVAVVAQFRNGGAMKHKSAPRAGAQNTEREYLDTYLTSSSTDEHDDSTDNFSSVWDR